MSVKVRIPPNLRGLTGNQDVVKTTGKDVGECIENLDAQFPGIKNSLCDKRGQLYNYYEIYVNSESSYPEELRKPVKDGDELTIAIFIAGG